MFETSVVQARAKAAARRPLLFSFSIAAHAAVIVAVVATSVASVSLPRNAPRQATFPVIRNFPQLKGDEGHGQKPQAKPAVIQPVVKRAPVPLSAVVAPTKVPEKVAEVSSTTVASTDTGPITSNGGNGSSTEGTGTPGSPNGDPNAIDLGQKPEPEPERPVIRVSKQPVVTHRVIPQYPPMMQKIRMNGFVLLDCTIDPTGHIREAHVVGSSNPAFEQSALDAVYQWQFEPGTMNGVPVNVEFELKVSFQIH
ncbi:MAG TPA: TonB family protein [Thermoanaerobaculia bacterium]|nr:TonB family protein [Thermoanaerobaculia bacterium]